MKTTDKELIQQIRQGESEAFNQLFRRYHKYVYSVCQSILDNPEDAEEVASDTFIHAYFKLDQIKNLDRFPVWLKRIAQNRSRDSLRSRQVESKKRQSESSAQGRVVPASPFSEQELMDTIMETIESLPQKDIEVIRARADGLSHVEISEKLGISYEASKARLYRARKKVTHRVRDLLYGIFGLFKILPIKRVISGGVMAMKIGTAGKIGIGVVGALCIGFIGFRIMIHRPDAELMDTESGHSQESAIETPARVTEKTASNELKLSDTPDSADVDAADAPSKPQDEISVEDANAFLTFLDGLNEKADESPKPSEAELKAERFRKKAAETRAEMEDSLYRCIDVGEEMLAGIEKAGKIKDVLEREAAFEILKELGYEQARLIVKIGNLEGLYSHYGFEEWQEAKKPGGWLYELKSRVRPGTPISM